MSPDTITTSFRHFPAVPGAQVDIVSGDRAISRRVSTIYPSTATELVVWREPWWSRALAWVIVGWFVTRKSGER